MELEDMVGAVLGDRNRVIAALGSALDVTLETDDYETLGLCAQRVAMLLGEPPTRQSDAMASPSRKHKAFLAFTEHWVIDVATIPDDVVAGVVEFVGEDGLRTFVQELLVVEQRIRLDIAWRKLGLVPA